MNAVFDYKIESTSLAEIKSRWKLVNETNDDGTVNYVMQIFAEPSKHSMFANITCVARDDRKDKKVSQLVKIRVAAFSHASNAFQSALG